MCICVFGEPRVLFFSLYRETILFECAYRNKMSKSTEKAKSLPCLLAGLVSLLISLVHFTLSAAGTFVRATIPVESPIVFDRC